MKTVYLAHPVRGDWKEGDGRQLAAVVADNMNRLAAIKRRLSLIHSGTMFYAPYVADVLALNDAVPAERATGILHTTELMNRGVFDELWVVGPLSQGVKAEIALAEKCGVKVVQPGPTWHEFWLGGQPRHLAVRPGDDSYLNGWTEGHRAGYSACMETNRLMGIETMH